MIYPKLGWDLGTAYDLFVSLKAIHSPANYGIRASWAAGVRSRLPNELRETLELANTIMRIPLPWLHTLPKPKSADVVLHCMAQISPAERLERHFFAPHVQNTYRDILANTKPNKKWSQPEVKILRDAFKNPFQLAPSNILDLLYKAWSNREAFGISYYAALKTYVESFFHEEEPRIIPSLHKGLAHAQARSGSLPAPAMLEELSLGVRMTEITQVANLVLAPSFWGAPFIFYDHLDENTLILLFGARPDDMALVPGDIVPDTLLRGLKALADPTRLRILRYLADGPQTPTQLARNLRLRTPTVVHHLLALRIAGLVQVTVSSHGERHYSTRLEGFDSTQENLVKFVAGE